MMEAYYLALEHGEEGQVYNLGSERAESVQEVLNMLLEMSEVKIRVVQEPSRLRPTDVPVVICDCSKFRERTGWHAKVSLRDSLESILEYWREWVSEHGEGQP
jgi:GDP-4-dehydro-6-deoxy-D-mannose reductase